MSSDWRPASLAHIPAEKPWTDDVVVVAEVRSFEEQPHAGQRRTFAVLVPVDQIDVVKNALANLGHEVRTSGPHPIYMEDEAYKPAFWVGTNGQPNIRYEPLVLSWMSHKYTVLQPDPGFLMTYGLMPRVGKDGLVYWDDPQAPRHGIVTLSPPSVWNFPLGTHAYVLIARDFLQDYLTLRHMALVQVFWEERWANIDIDIEDRLGDQQSVNVDFSDRRFQLNRAYAKRTTICAQV